MDSGEYSGPLFSLKQSTGSGDGGRMNSAAGNADMGLDFSMPKARKQPRTDHQSSSSSRNSAPVDDLLWRLHPQSDLYGGSHHRRTESSSRDRRAHQPLPPSMTSYGMPHHSSSSPESYYHSGGTAFRPPAPAKPSSSTPPGLLVIPVSISAHATAPALSG